MERSALDALLTDSLLLDAVEGLDSIANRLAHVYDEWRCSGVDSVAVDFLGVILTDLGWWKGRLLGGVSEETAQALNRLTSGDA